MTFFLKNLKLGNLKAKSCKLNRGMTYIELIVVLSIFAVLSSVVVFNYGDFQARVDIRNLSSDIALKVVEAQKAALSGALPQTAVLPTWKPSYGVYFNTTTPTQFIYFVDLDSLGDLSGGETLETISITKNNSISSIDACYATPCVPNPLGNLTITFSRPNSGAILNPAASFIPASSYAQITILSPRGSTSLIKLYKSGRVQIN